MTEINIASRKLFLEDVSPPTKSATATLILIHGAGGSRLTWRRQSDELSAEYRVIAVDLPGHGMSEGPGETTIRKYTDCILELIGALKLPKVILGGHSMGGAIALQTALLQPEKLGGLVLVGTGARLRVLPAIFSALKEDFDMAIEAMTGFTFGPAAPEELINEEKQLLAKNTSEILVGDFTACDSFDIMENVGSIKLPTLILCGTEDKLTPPKYAEYLRQKIEKSTLTLFDECGHMPMLEKSKKFNDCVSSFLTGL